MTVKRYTPTQCCEHDGTYVTYSGYQKLVAENAALKLIINEVGDLSLSPHIQKLCEVEAPATDAAIAEINKPIFEAMAELAGSMLNDAINVKGKEAKAFTICADRTAKLSANLRAGRKG